MTPTEAGFVKYATDVAGLPKAYATQLFRSISSQPDVAALLKDAEQQQPGQVQGKPVEPGTLEMLATLMKQELIDRQMQHYTQESPRRNG